MSNMHDELKKEFQLERMILFSDAVFAIAITLMVIELKVPVLDGEVTDSILLSHLAPLLYKLFGFLLSFFIIGLYWTVHHRMFKYVENYTSRLLWLNLFLLLSIILMPFSSDIYGEYTANINLRVPYGIYVINICLIGYFYNRLWKYIGNPKNKVASHLLTPEMQQQGMQRGLITPIVFLVSFAITLLVPFSTWFAVVGRWIPAFTPLVMRLLQKKQNKKNQPLPVQHS